MVKLILWWTFLYLRGLVEAVGWLIISLYVLVCWIGISQPLAQNIIFYVALIGTITAAMPYAYRYLRRRSNDV